MSVDADAAVCNSRYAQIDDGDYRTIVVLQLQRLALCGVNGSALDLIFASAAQLELGLRQIDRSLLRFNFYSCSHNLGLLFINYSPFSRRLQDSAFPVFHVRQRRHVAQDSAAVCESL